MSYRELLDRPIAFQRAFTKLGAGITGALMLSQAVYWSNRTSDVDGWFYKTMDEWHEETGLSVKEQATARTKLKAKGILEEVKKGIPCKIFFKVNFDKLEEELKNLGGKPRFAEPANLEQPNQQDSVCPNSKPITENTAETTTESKKINKKSSRLADDFSMPNEWILIAQQIRPELPDSEIQLAADSFVDYWKAKAGKEAVKADWLATWRNWMRNHRARNIYPPKHQKEPIKSDDDWTAGMENML